MKLFRCKKDIDPVEEKFNMIVSLIKDLSRPDYNRLKEGMDYVYNGYNKVRNAKTDEEKAIEKEAKENADIDIMEKVLEKEEK